MTSSKAFIKSINPNGSGPDEDNAVHQSSPAWVLTFARWAMRDTIRTENSKDITSTSIRDTLVVENDCIQLSITIDKGTLTPSLNAILVQTDVNYETAVLPGDFVFANMLNWDSHARRVADNARALAPINGAKDGFKGMFKVQSVRKTITVDPISGTKILLFKITAFGFTEFNNIVYFNPYLIDKSEKNFNLYITNIGDIWASIISAKGTTSIQDIMKNLTESFIGVGVSRQGRIDKTGNVKSPNVHFFMPSQVGALLGIPGVKAAKDIYTFLFGIQDYSGSATDLGTGMNPSGLKEESGKFFYTPTKCQGDTVLKGEYWNQVSVWSIMKQFTNSPLNELYTCFKIDQQNKVMPTVVFRQIPFTTEGLESSIKTTRFLNLPRWKISPSLVTMIDIGRDEAARFNFVQYFGRSTINNNGWEISEEIAQGNFVFDFQDVQRNGLKPYVITSQFDEVSGDKTKFLSPQWAKILGDSLIGGHLKLNGTIECAGIVDPIAVGDNLEFDNTVYHIEQINHNCNISTDNGNRIFRTTISLSNGVSSADSVYVRYSEMEFPRAKEFREEDYKNNQTNPGVSESQDTVYRKYNPDVDDHKFTNKPFIQPNKKTIKKGQYD